MLTDLLVPRSTFLARLKRLRRENTEQMDLIRLGLDETAAYRRRWREAQEEIEDWGYSLAETERKDFRRRLAAQADAETELRHQVGELHHRAFGAACWRRAATSVRC